MNITVLGMGLMGLPIGLRLQQCGHDVVAWNRSEDRLQSAKEQGLPVEPVLEAAIEQAELVVLTLSDAQAIHDVLLSQTAGQDLVGKQVLQMGTIAPNESKEISRQVKASGAEYLEAPVLGSIPEARSGSLIVMAAGPEPVYQHCLLMLRCLGKEVEYVGEVGQAAAMKLAMNQLIATLTTGFSLSLGLLRAEGVDVNQFMGLLRESALYAPTFDKKLPKMLAHDYANPNFPLKHLHKDLALFQQVAAENGIDNSLLQAILQLLERGQVEGHAEDDYSALYETINSDVDLGVDQGC